MRKKRYAKKYYNFSTLNEIKFSNTGKQKNIKIK